MGGVEASGKTVEDAIEQALGELDVPMSRYHSERYSFA